MAKNLRNILVDGWTNLLGGLDSSRAPNLLPKNACAFAVNVTLRDGFAETRPPFVKRTLTFQSDDAADWWARHRIQGWEYFDPLDSPPLIAASIGGRVFTIDPLANFLVREIVPTKSSATTAAFISPPIDLTTTISVSPTVSGGSTTDMESGFVVTIGDGDYVIQSVTNLNLVVKNLTATPGVSVPSGSMVVYLDRNPINRPKAWLKQAEQYLIVQDGQSAAIIFDGAKSRRAIASESEVPTGTAMEFNEEIGRLVIAVGHNEITIGDIENILKFTETIPLNEGGNFRMPHKFGEIVAIRMMANLDRSNGQGAMLVFAERGMSAFNLPVARATWKNLPYPLQINMPLRFSAASHTGIVQVNADMFFRAKDGLRTFIMAIREFGKWGNVPLSREMNRIIGRDDENLLQFASAELSNNRLLFTVTPQPDAIAGCGAYFKGLAVLDFDLINSLGDKMPPVYDGLWSGLDFTGLITGEFNGEDRSFAFVRTPTGGVDLWELMKTGAFDGDDGKIEAQLESRAMDFDKPDEEKRLEACEIWVDKVWGETTFVLEYRSDQYTCWLPWATRKICNVTKDCETDCGLVREFQEGYRSRIAFGQPPDTDEANALKLARNGYQFQVRITWTGRARIRMGLIRATIVPEPPYGNPPP